MSLGIRVTQRTTGATTVTLHAAQSFVPVLSVARVAATENSKCNVFYCRPLCPGGGRVG